MYRNEFILPKEKSGKTIKLKFEGIIYRANIWLNGKQIASGDSIAEVYRMFEFDVSKIIKLKEKNALAVEVFPPVLCEPSIGFVDWNPIPPDKSIRICFLFGLGQIILGSFFLGIMFLIAGLVLGALFFTR